MANSGRIASAGRLADSEHGKKGIEFAARAGYVVKGVIYGTVGVLALMTALGFSGGRIIGTRSAIEVLRSQPFGRVVLWAILIGLVGYVVWRFVQAIADTEHKGDDARGLAARTGLLVSGIAYGSLAVFASTLLFGGGSNGSGASSSQQSTATLMQYSWGIWVVGLIGAVIAGVAAYQAYRAWAAPFVRHWKTAEMTAGTLKWSRRASQLGIAARALAFALIAWFFVQAALQADPSEARGLDGALQSFYGRPYGEIVLGAVGAGLLCYALYCAMNARYRRIDP